MNSESEHQPRGPAGPRESASGAPGPPASHRPAGPPGPSREAAPPPAAAPGPSEPATPASASDAASEAAPPAADAPVTEVTGEEPAPRPGPQGDISPEQVREHLRRRAVFLRELAEARELRARVTPHRSRRARIHAALRRRTFRIN